MLRVTILACVAAAASAPAVADTLKLEGGQPLSVQCGTKSVVVATNAAKATSGAIRLELDLKLATAEKPKSGTWTIVAVDAAHTGTFGVAEREMCAKGCPFTVAADGTVQLWAPQPKTIDKLADDETLLIAVIKPGTLALRASTFRGKEIEALEEGQCRLAP